MTSPDINSLLPVYAAYLIVTASPGPSNMTIMGVAMSRGRSAGLAVATGVIAGSMSWALLAATGLSAVLTRYAEALLVIKIAGGLYLLYLAAKSARTALRATPDAQAAAAGEPQRFGTLFRRGYMLHLTNPKAILGWLAIMSLGLHPEAAPHTLEAIIAGCALLGVTVFSGYALVFSTPLMVHGYRKVSRWIEGTLSLFFGYAGLRLLLSRA